jgi:predicted ATPase/transcriptional regulator with XRE-family HTH domain
LAEVSFGEWLKRRRGAQGWTQKQLAQQINCSISSLRKMEAEERRPSAEVIERLADIFRVPQQERKAFQRFTRGDWHAISSADQEDSPWCVASSPTETQIESVTSRHNLPLQLTSFIGRTKEQADVIELLAKHRLVSLVGTGGIGKTRLSLEVGYAVIDTFPNGLWCIELAPLSDPALIPQAIASALGLIEQANRPSQTILIDFLKDRKVLLILDNCEHLIQACARLTEALLQVCPDLNILTTSREALNVPGEIVYLVPSLSTPVEEVALEPFSRYEAVELFMERARSAVPAFAMTDQNATAIAQICHHLDGIPLAIELAAARVRGLSVEQIASRLNDRFRLLAAGARTVLPRHQTLQALIDWSHDLLTETERVALRRFSVFAGGWTLEAAEQVCAGAGLESNEILDPLLRLVDKSLVIARTQEAETRYHMLETIRQYAHEKLWEAGEGELLRKRHLAYFVDLAERAEPNLRAFDMVMWLDRLETELDNIRATLEYALESNVEAQLRLASALLWFWHIRGHKNEGVDWLERGLSIEAGERGDQSLTPDRAMIRGKALNASGFLMNMFFNLKKGQARFEESLTLFQERGSAGKRGVAYALLWGVADALPSADNAKRTLVQQSLTLFREVGDKFGAAECFMQLTSIARNDNDIQQAILFAEEQLALRKEIGDQDGIASALYHLGYAVFWQNDLPRAITLIEESLAIFRQLRNKWAVGIALSSYGDICSWQGRYEQATEIYKKAFAFARDLGDRYLIALNLYSLGIIAWFQGDYAQATQKIEEGLTVFRDIGEDWLTASSLHALGDIALAQGEDRRAVQWYEAELTFGQDVEINATQAFAFCGLGKVAWTQNNDELAIHRFEEGLKMSQATDFKYGTFHALYGLGRVSQSKGDYPAARTYFLKMLELQRLRLSPLFRWNWLKTYGYAIAYPLDGFAVLAAAQNMQERAARLLSAAENLYTPLRFEMSAKERAEHHQAIASARTALGEEAFAVAYEEGRRMSLDEAVAYALGDAEANVG